MEGDILQRQADYWKNNLSEAPALLELPADHPRPAEQNYAGAFSELVLEGKLTTGLKDLGRRHGTTLYMTLLAGWATLLARLSGQQDVIVGTPVANRGRSEIGDLIGFFVNTLVLRLDLSGAPMVSELLERVKVQVIAAQQNQDIPFEQVVEMMRPLRSLAYSPLFQVMFAWQNTPEGKLTLPDLELKPLQLAPHWGAKFDLTLFLREEEGSIVGGIEYATSLFEPATIERYLGYFHALLDAMVSDDTQTVNCLSMLGDLERDQLLYGWNDTAREFPRDKCIHELFEEQVEQRPDAVAVVHEDRELSYAELNRRANQLAHYLRGVGVRPDTRVAICMERGFEMIVALLAVLKAGGAYVPLDPAYPAERLGYMLEDSSPAALLTQSRLKGLFSEFHTISVVDLTEGASLWQDRPETNPSRTIIGLTPTHLAYVIYTSGSTGLPKGVLVEHRNVLRLVMNNGYARFEVIAQVG
jgi:non-ribosomal peptide synthetase component F